MPPAGDIEMSKIPDAAVRAAAIKDAGIAGRTFDGLSKYEKERFLSRSAEMITAAIPHLPLGFEVKQLEWDFLSGDYYAQGCGTQYNAYETNPNRWNAVVTSPKNIRLVTHGTLAEAKAAAQADFERRVRECITLTNEGTKPVDVAAVRSKEWLVKWYGSEPMKGASIWSSTDHGLHGDNLFHIGGGENHLELARAIADAHNDTIRALSAEPAQGEQWQDMKALSELSKRTYAIQYNPNCPDKYLVRLPNNGAIDLKPYGNAAFHVSNQTNDILGFGKTLHEAYTAAIDAPAPEAEA